MSKEYSGKELKELALQTAERVGVGHDSDARIYFTTPKPGPSFMWGDFAMHIPKDVAFAPYLLDIHPRVHFHNIVYREDPITISNTSESYSFSFTPWQFSTMFGGLYKPGEFAQAVRPYIDSDDDWEETPTNGMRNSSAALSILETLHNHFFQVGYKTGFYPYDTNISSRLLIGPRKQMNTLAQQINPRYGPCQPKKPVETRKFSDFNRCSLYNQAFDRFPKRWSEIIWLCGFKQQDHFVALAKRFTVDDKPLTLTHYYEQFEPIHVPHKFSDDALWERYGMDIIGIYSLYDAPIDVAQHALSYPLTEAWKFLHGMSCNERYF